MTTSDYASMLEILTEITGDVEDRELKKGFTKGWYMQMIKYGIKDLAYVSHYHRFDDTKPMPDNRIIKVPSGGFNIKDVRIHSEACCDLNNSQSLEFKMNSVNEGSGYVAGISESGGTSVHPNRSDVTSTQRYWASFVNDEIHLSPSCGVYGFVTVYCEGFGRLVEGRPVIPGHFRQAVVAYVQMRVSRRMSRGKRDRLAMYEYREDIQLYDKEKEQAMIIQSRMDPFVKKRMNEYITNFMTK